MITTRELYKWRDEILRTKEEAEKLAENYDQEMVEYYEHLSKVSGVQLALIERLIEQSRANEKEKVETMEKHIENLGGDD